MRYSSLLPALASLALAQDPVAVADNPDPTPDALPLDDLRDIPVPTYTVATGVTAQDIPYATSSAIAVVVSEVAATPLSVFPAATDVPINSAGDSGSGSDENASSNVIVNTGSKLKRGLTGTVRQPRYKRGDCSKQPTIANTYNVDVSSSDAFIADASIADVADNARTPAGYYQNFKNKQSANSAMNYLGYYVLPSAEYDTQWCADKCDAKAGCLSFNIYFERDPTIDPGASCPNPDAFANIKCSLWGTGLDEKTLTNPGQWREKFWVAIAGSNAYTSYKLGGPIDGWTGPQDLGNAAMNAPLWDCENKWSYLGYKLLQAGSVDPNLCAAACDAQTAYNKAHPTATDPYACNAFGSYILTKKNSTGSYQVGQMCTMYTAYWDVKYAKNTGSSDPSIGATYSYSHSSFYGKKGAQLSCSSDFQASSGTYIKGGVDKKASIKAASSAISASSLQPYCSSILGYTIPLTTTVVTATSIPISTDISVTVQTDIVTTTTTEAFTATVTANAKRDVSDKVQTPTVSTVIDGVTALALPTIPAAPVKRAISQPSALAQYPADIVTSACSAAVQPVTTTSVVTNTVTTTAATSFTTSVIVSTTQVTETVTVQSTSTLTSVATPACTSTYKFVVASGSTNGRNGNVIGGQGPESDSDVTYAFVNYASASDSTTWTIRSDGSIYSANNKFGWTTTSDDLYYVLQMTDHSRDVYGSVGSVTCTIDAGNTPAGVAGAVGQLSCTNTRTSIAIDLAECEQAEDALIQASRGTASSQGCNALTIAAVPVKLC